MDAAAVQWRFGLPRDAARLDAWKAQVCRGPLTPVRGATNRSIRVAEAEPELRFRRERFRLLLLRKAYRLDCWLPPEALLNVRRIDWDDTGARLLLTLWSGTQLLDTGDRIVMRGHADDVSVREMAACVERRGWGSVVVEGDQRFSQEMARELLRRGIEVEDCPLLPGEVEALRAEAGAAGVQPPPHGVETRPGTGLRG